jgi:hypothetical protein
VGDLGEAGAAPGGPEVEQDELAPVSIEVDGLTGEIGAVEVRSGFEGCAGFGVGLGLSIKAGGDSEEEGWEQEETGDLHGLAAFGCGVAFVNPVGAEVVGQVEDFEVGETEGVELVIGGGDIGAAAPGAAAAVEDDGSVFGELRYAVAQGLEAGVLAGGAGVFGVGDVGFGEEDVGAYLQNEGFRCGCGMQGGR